MHSTPAQRIDRDLRLFVQGAGLATCLLMDFPVQGNITGATGGGGGGRQGPGLSDVWSIGRFGRKKRRMAGACAKLAYCSSIYDIYTVHIAEGEGVAARRARSHWLQSVSDAANAWNAPAEVSSSNPFCMIRNTTEN
jgi:hypothetical protein